MLPRLRAAYKKYGSWALGWPVWANHFWSSGALVATTRKGTPTTSVRTPSVAGMGLPPAGGAKRSELNGPPKSTNRKSSGRARRARRENTRRATGRHRRGRGGGNRRGGGRPGGARPPPGPPLPPFVRISKKLVDFPSTAHYSHVICRTQHLPSLPACRSRRSTGTLGCPSSRGKL